jgi:hypothetical protein
MDSIERRIHQVEESHCYRERKTKKPIGETIKKDLKVNGLDKHMIYDNAI